MADADAGQLKARDVSLPNSLPRPAHELEQLRRAWRTPSGWRFLTVVNNSYIGIFYVAAAFLFFLLAGILALLMRTQRAVPDNTLVGPTLYSQLFTMHGTTMMFLFAVPAVEAMAVLLLPGMLAARDLPFRGSPRTHSGLFLAASPSLPASSSACATGGGSFIRRSPAQIFAVINEDFWLLAILSSNLGHRGAIEIIVACAHARGPHDPRQDAIVRVGDNSFRLQIVFAFPAIIVATALLELERSFDWPSSSRNVVAIRCFGSTCRSSASGRLLIFCRRRGWYR